jgi:zinc protease
VSAILADSALVTATLLANGLKVLVMEQHATPVVAVQVWYRVGSHDEQSGSRGVAHLFEHMMFRGSENIGPEEHARLIKEIGGSPNAGTSEDYTVYRERLPASGLDLALKLEAERMHLLKLNQDVLNTELNVVREEFRMYQNSPFGELMIRLPKLLYPNHPYNCTPAGKLEDLNRITLAECREFYDRYYAPNNAVLVVVGDVTRPEVLRRAEQHFGGLPVKATPAEPDLSLVLAREMRRFTEKVKLPVPVTGVGFLIPGAKDADIIPLQVLASILSSGESSRLNKSLVRRQELAVGAMGYPLIHQGPGYFVFGAAHLPNVTHRRIESALWQEVERMKTAPVTDAELNKARNQLLAGKVFERYSCDNLAFSIGYAEVIEGDYRLYEREVAEFGRVTKDDVMRVANKYFARENATVVYLQPKQNNPLIWLYGLVKSIF